MRFSNLQYYKPKKTQPGDTYHFEMKVFHGQDLVDSKYARLASLSLLHLVVKPGVREILLHYNILNRKILNFEIEKSIGILRDRYTI